MTHKENDNKSWISRLNEAGPVPSAHDPRKARMWRRLEQRLQGKKTRSYKYMYVAAACLLVLICLPWALNIKKTGQPFHSATVNTVTKPVVMDNGLPLQLPEINNRLKAAVKPIVVNIKTKQFISEDTLVSVVIKPEISKDSIATIQSPAMVVATRKRKLRVFHKNQLPPAIPENNTAINNSFPFLRQRLQSDDAIAEPSTHIISTLPVVHQ
jgi:hypothetical protein